MKKIKHQCCNCKFYRPLHGSGSSGSYGYCKWKPRTKIALPFCAFIARPTIVFAHRVRGFRCDCWELKEK